MATLDLDKNASSFQIRAFKPGLIQVNEKKLTRSLIITPDALIENWGPQIIDELTAQSLMPVARLKPDILLIGTGTMLVFPPTNLYGDLINNGTGVEIMDTHAACRTFNALSSEYRNVAAALIIK